jgi:hypothetical protein
VKISLPIHHGGEQRAERRAPADAGAHKTLAASLIERHYDAAYDRSRRAAARIAQTVNAWTPAPWTTFPPPSPRPA